MSNSDMLMSTSSPWSLCPRSSGAAGSLASACTSVLIFQAAHKAPSAITSLRVPFFHYFPPPAMGQTSGEPETHHRKKPPDRIRGLRAHTNPVLGPVNVELDVLVQLSRRVIRRLLRHRIVCPDHLEGLAVSRGPATRMRLGVSSSRLHGTGLAGWLVVLPCLGDDDIVEWGIFPSETGKSEFDHHCCLLGFRANRQTW